MSDNESRNDNAPAPAAMTTSIESAASWEDMPESPHRIENHVKVYLHLEESSAAPVVADPDNAPAGTRIYQRNSDGRPMYGTVTGWITEGTGVFVAFDHAGTYSGPTFGSIFIAETDPETDAEAGPGAMDVRATISGSRWVVSDVTVDGYPLDGVEDGHYCDYEGHPPGARADWDRQHRAATRQHLPTAEELLPLLATALGTSVEGPTVDQRRTASDLIAEHAQRRAERAPSPTAESAHSLVSDWHTTDEGRDLTERAMALLAEITCHQAPGDPTPIETARCSPLAAPPRPARPQPSPTVQADRTPRR